MTSDIRRRATRLGAVLLAVGVLNALSVVPARAQDRRIDSDAKRVSDATAAFSQIASVEAKGIPRAVLEKAEAIVIFPSQPAMPRRRGQGPNTLRTARLLDIRGRGILSVRGGDGAWSPPAFVELSGGTFPDESDVVFVIVTPRGLESIMRRQFNVDADAVVAPGPVVADAQALTASQERADIFSYSRSRGALAGTAISGSIIQADANAHQRFYGKPLTSAQAIAQTGDREPVPAWQSALKTHTGR